jgi:hypothetical protein
MLTPITKTQNFFITRSYLVTRVKLFSVCWGGGVGGDILKLAGSLLCKSLLSTSYASSSSYAEPV